MRISDWSSDVCSSDLVRHEHQTLEARSRFAECDAVCRRVKGQHRFRAGAVVEADHLLAVGPGDGPQCPFAIEGKAADAQILVAAPLGKAAVLGVEQRNTGVGRNENLDRSEESRVGKECVSTWRSRG